MRDVLGDREAVRPFLEVAELNPRDGPGHLVRQGRAVNPLDAVPFVGEEDVGVSMLVGLGRVGVEEVDTARLQNLPSAG